MEKQPLPLTESQFVASINRAEITFRGEFDMALTRLNELLNLKYAYRNALEDGLKLDFFEQNGFLSFNAHPKKQVGFSLPVREIGETKP